jgi:hypothetical protein
MQVRQLRQVKPGTAFCYWDGVISAINCDQETCKRSTLMCDGGQTHSVYLNMMNLRLSKPHP